MKLVVVVCLVGWTLSLPEEDYSDPMKLAALIRDAESAGTGDELKTRLWGGWYARLGVFRYMAGLLVNVEGGLEVTCGATLVTRDRLLTAAQCWISYYRGVSVVVVLGSFWLHSGGVRIGTDQVLVHPLYSPLPHYNHSDIAIITLPHYVTYTAKIEQATLPLNCYSKEPYDGYFGYLMGFGRTENDTAYRRGLGIIDVNIITNELCSRALNGSYVPRSVMCGAMQHRGACKGDAGGGLTVPINNDKVLVGILAGVYPGRCRIGKPAFFTRVSYYLPWINENL